jgi:spore germination protein YaaH
MSLKRYRNLTVALLLAVGQTVVLAPSATSHTAPMARTFEARPSIMQTAAAMAAKPALQALEPFGATTPLASPSIALAASSGLRREVFGFANAGNLGNSTVGYTSWNFSLLSTIAYFGLQVNSGDGALVQTDTGWSVYHSATMSGFVSAAHAAGTRVIVSLNLQDFTSSPTNQVCQGLIASHAQTTITQGVQQMAAAGIDGINVDYEGVNTTCANGASSRAQLVSFVGNLRAAMPRGTYLAIDTYAGSAEGNGDFFDITGLAPFVDSFFVMAYDMDYSNYHYPPLNCSSYCFNPVSPLTGYRYNDTLSLAQYTALVPASKVILGLPYYGRKGCVPGRDIANQYPTRFDAPYFVAPPYTYAVSVPTDTGVSYFSSHRDSGDGVSEWDTWYSSDFTCNREQFWDDVQSLGAKYDLVNRTNVRGVGLFTLDYGGGSPELWNSLASHFACSSNMFIVTGDFNGDAKADLAVGGIGTCLKLSTGSAFSTPAAWTPLPFVGSRATLAGDVTGTGKAALVAVNDSQTFVMTSTGTGFNAPAGWSTTPFYGTRGTFLADVNGDGKADLVAVNDNSVWVMLSTGSGFGPPTMWSNVAFFGDVTTFMGDVTGDHKADLVAVNHGSVWVMASTGSGFGPPAMWSNTAFYGEVATLIGDVNGDGKADLVAVNRTSSWVMASSGARFGPPTMWANFAFYGELVTTLADVAGGGKASLVAVSRASSWVAASTGTGFAAPAQWYSGPP